MIPPPQRPSEPGGGVILPDRRAAALWVAQRQGAGGRVVVTNGCFDLLHVGHVRYLAAARALGDALLVGLNADASPACRKGPGRPLVGEDERAEVLAALRCVDAVTLFTESTAEALLAALRPAVYAKGADYTLPSSDASKPGAVDEARLPEARVVRSYGGTVVLLAYHGGHSTTALVARLRGEQPG